MYVCVWNSRIIQISGYHVYIYIYIDFIDSVILCSRMHLSVCVGPVQDRCTCASRMPLSILASSTSMKHTP